MNVGIGLSVSNFSSVPTVGLDLDAVIAALFSSGEEGAWYDPSDLSTLYQDAAGNTPVTGTGQPVGLMLDKSKGGVSATELVTNGTFDTDLTDWGIPANSSGTVSWESGAIRITRTGTVAAASQQVLLEAGKTYRVTCTYYVVSGSGVGIYIAYKGSDNATSGTVASSSVVGSAGSSGTLQFIYKPLANGAVFLMPLLYGGGLGAVDFDNISVRELPGNHATQSTSTARPTLQVTGTTPATLGSELVTNGTFDSDLASWTTGSGTATWVSGAAQLTGAIGATGRIYQTRTFTANTWYKLSADCVSATGTTAVLEIIGQTSQTVSSGQTATLYWRAPSSGSFYVQVRTDNTGAVSATWDNISVKEVLTWADPKYYLDFDGADDCLQTPAIDFSITDKMSVFAGITKETDSVAAIICELTAISINPGAFSLFAGNPVANRRFVWSVAATQTLIGTNSYPAPATVVNSLLIDRAGTDAASTLFPRINGSTPSLDDAVDNNVPGNFSNSNLNIGARDNGASNRLNGRIYGLIVRGVLSTAAEIEATESYLATKSGVTLP